MIDQIWKKNAQTHRNMKMVEGAAKIRFSSENFLKESQMVLLEVSQNFLQKEWRMKNLPQKDEFWNWNISKLRMVHIWQLEILTYARISFLILFAFNLILNSK